MATRTETKPEVSAPAPGAAELLGAVEELARELHPGRRPPGGFGLDSSLERELGLDSLGRVELLLRVERAFGVSLPESVLATAETPRDLLRALAARTGAGGTGAPAEAELALPLAAAEAAPERTRTLVEVLRWHVERHPGRRHVAFHPGEGPAEELTYGDLHERGKAVASGLLERGLEPGRAVGIMLPSGLDYFAAFVGALLAGGVPVPLYPPARKSQIEDHLRRQAGILTTARAATLVTFSEVLPLARLLRAQVPGLGRVETVADLAAAGAGVGTTALPPVAEGDVAFLQFTSGSTGNPKGVVLTHGNLLANLRAIGRSVEIGPDDVVVSWLPLYHDMGLIGAWMASLYYGLPLALMSPLTFLARPSRWLWAVHRHRGTLSAAPNFAYELCAAKIDEAELDGLDLSSWRAALNGAEPVSPEALRRFGERFSRYGFRPEALLPVYGLAEASLAVAFPPLGRGPRIDAVAREPFQRSGRAEPAAADDPKALRFVSCGPPLPGVEVRIVDATGREAEERREGRLELRGPSTTSGYFRDPEATRRLFRGDWLDSGDLAYTAGGEIYVTGRVKDVILRGGRNLYPHELEQAVGEVPGVRKGCVAVFGSPDPATGTERLVVLAETRERGPAARERLAEAIQNLAVDLLGTPPDDVVLAPPHAVPKTSSGKVRRAAARELYARGRLGRGGAALAWQLARLAGSGARQQLARGAAAAGAFAWAAWFWLLFALAALPVWAAMAVVPGRERRRRLARRVARLLAAAAGVPLRVQGLESLPPGPCLLAANHASYLDGFVLTAALPPRAGYVVKGELERRLVPRVLLSRLGALFVERFDAGQSAGEAHRAAAALRAGETLAIFPEGTFHRAAGLHSFRMGGFVAAAEAGTPVVPVAIRGTRSVLRGGTWLPRCGPVAVTVLPPVHPEGAGWTAAVRLRDAVRAAILERCGEPDLAHELLELPRPDAALPVP